MSRNTLIGLVVLVLVAVGIIWFVNRDQEETATPVLSISAFNQTKNVSATDRAANSDDVIVYTLIAENQHEETISGYIMEVNISGITDKASLVDASGASYNAATSSLVWTPLDIPADDSISRQFSVRVNAAPSGSENRDLSVQFNNEITIPVAVPLVSGDTTTTPPYVAPPTGAEEYIPVLLAMLATAAFITVRKFKLINT